MQEGVVIEHKGACNCMQGGGCLPPALALAIVTALVHFTSTSTSTSTITSTRKVLIVCKEIAA